MRRWPASVSRRSPAVHIPKNASGQSTASQLPDTPAQLAGANQGPQRSAPIRVPDLCGDLVDARVSGAQEIATACSTRRSWKLRQRCLAQKTLCQGAPGARPPPPGGGGPQKKVPPGGWGPPSLVGPRRWPPAASGKPLVASRRSGPALERSTIRVRHAQGWSGITNSALRTACPRTKQNSVPPGPPAPDCAPG